MSAALGGPSFKPYQAPRAGAGNSTGPEIETAAAAAESTTASSSRPAARPGQWPSLPAGARVDPETGRIIVSSKEEYDRLKAEHEAMVEEHNRQLDLKYGAEQVLALFIPVSVCMAVVVATIRSVDYFSQGGTQFIYTPFETDAAASTGEKLGGALLNVLIVLGVIVCMTMFLVLLYKYRCYKVIHGWLIFSSILLLFYFSYEYFTQLFKATNQAMDWITLVFMIWNFGCVGMVAVHYKAPLIVQQVYLVCVSALMALILIKNLPDWTTWALLALIAVYDLVAVLWSHGPLRMLVNLAQERDEPLFPALIYSSTMVWIVSMADIENGTGRASGDRKETTVTAAAAGAAGGSGGSGGAGGARDVASFASSGNNNAAVARNASESEAEAEEEEEEDASGVKLGLGDFIFYSVLVGKAATSNDWTTIVSCYIGILIGLAATLLLLSIFKKALPALPISIFFGLVFYFTVSHTLQPMMDMLAANQVLI